MLIRDFVQSRPTLTAVLLYVGIYLIIVATKPSLVFNSDGSIRQFGLAFSRRTIIPIWLAAIVLAVLCYMAVLYYISAPYLLNG